jgi:hypothetical protein
VAAKLSCHEDNSTLTVTINPKTLSVGPAYGTHEAEKLLLQKTVADRKHVNFSPTALKKESISARGLSRVASCPQTENLRHAKTEKHTKKTDETGISGMKEI